MDDSLTYTIFVPFTRLWAVETFLKNFEEIDFDWRRSEIVFYNDTNDHELQYRLFEWLQTHKNKLHSYDLHMSLKPKLDEIGNQVFVNQRRDRIVQMRKDSLRYIGDTKYLFCLEDDTLPPKNAFSRLLKIIEQYPKCGIVSGIQKGRWTYPILGAWQIEPLHKPIEISTVSYQHKGVQEVSATGWYCFMTPTALYKKADFRFEAECLGPDVCYGWDLSRGGRHNYIDWGVKCGHLSNINGREVTLPVTEDTQVHIWHKQGDSWNIAQRTNIEI